MVSIDLVGVTNYVLKNVTVHVESGSIHVVLGPNGAGKTTLLKVIAGLTRYKGNVLFDGVPVDNVPPWKRGVGYVPQSNALFPHMTVLENVLFGLKNKGVSYSEALSTAKHYLELLGIYELRNRYPLTLSGGEQKKVALARALVLNPRILLLDEPFTGIHYDYRVQLMEVIRMVSSKEKPTIVLVTHDLDEAVSLGSRYTVLVNGKNVYTGGFPGLFKAINKYLEYINVFECSIEGFSSESGLARINCSGTVFTAPVEHYVGNKVLATIPADKIVLLHVARCFPRVNCFRGTVVEARDLGNGFKLVKISVGKLVINVLTNTSVVGSEVTVKLPVRELRIYPAPE